MINAPFFAGPLKGLFALLLLAAMTLNAQDEAETDAQPAESTETAAEADADPPPDDDNREVDADEQGLPTDLEEGRTEVGAAPAAAESAPPETDTGAEAETDTGAETETDTGAETDGDPAETDPADETTPATEDAAPDDGEEPAPAPPVQAPPREIQISADTVDMRLAEGKGQFAGNVLVLDQGLRITANVLDIELNEASQITSAVFTGDVTIQQEKEDRSATAERAEYHMERGELVLTGNPVLRVGTNTLRNAERIIYNRSTERILTEGERPQVTIPLAPASDGGDEQPSEDHTEAP